MFSNTPNLSLSFSALGQKFPTVFLDLTGVDKIKLWHFHVKRSLCVISSQLGTLRWKQSQRALFTEASVSRGMAHNSSGWTSDQPCQNQRRIYQQHSSKMKSIKQSKANWWIAVVIYSFQELLPNCPASCGGGKLCKSFIPGAFQLVVPLWTPLDAHGFPRTGLSRAHFTNAVEDCQRTMWWQQELQHWKTFPRFLMQCIYGCSVHFLTKRCHPPLDGVTLD